MSITYIKELPGGSERSDGKTILIRHMLYQVDGGSDPRDILFSTEIPGDGMTHPDYSGYYAIGVSSPSLKSGDSSKGMYDVAVKYGPASLVPFENKDKADKGLTEQGARDLTFTAREVVVPQLFAYKENDVQFKPTKPLIHPLTGEQLVADTVEKHGIISFNYVVKTFKYSWIRRFTGTCNAAAITIAGIPIPQYHAQLIELSASRKAIATTKSGTQYVWGVNVKIEDYYREITKQLALMGYLMCKGGKNYPIQLKNGGYDFFDAAHPEYNITTPRLVSKTSGLPMAAGYSGSFDDYYDTFDDVFTADWSALCLPATEA